ncbi:MAG: hypothetical protein QGI68_07835 [Pseudomonadales bacterium]|jgi:hypothetical protein|nr:hypothetical protein [Pseudomonadales bacterium]MDP7595464.1 hypothetical protein [Pseudomonadales bacterium]HJN52416.1 hypothetical protein [Pseudomonadales bacterium]|tara:strand:- start:1433 stop:1729 length:297 start_codon:yes stop_codon:yes gene_type:complete
MSYRDYEPVDLQRAGFKIHQLEGFEKDNIENAFAGYVLKVVGKINDGKEAQFISVVPVGTLASPTLLPRFSSPEPFATSKPIGTIEISEKCETVEWRS